MLQAVQPGQHSTLSIENRSSATGGARLKRRCAHPGCSADHCQTTQIFPVAALTPSPEGVSQRLQVDCLTMPVAVECTRSRVLLSTAPANRERTTVGEAVGGLGLARPAAKRLVRRFTTGHIGDGSGHRAGAIRRHQHRHIRHFSQLGHPFQQRSLCQLGLEGVS